MKLTLTHMWRRLTVAVSCGAILVAVGCNDEQPETEAPPSGKGSLVVQNFTSDSINVFVGGVQTAIVDSVGFSVVYLDPGLYRVVLDQDDGPRNYRDDVDILMGKRTILYVDYNTTNANLYSVVMDFD